jgi:hypothetical protein
MDPTTIYAAAFALAVDYCRRSLVEPDDGVFDAAHAWAEKVVAGALGAQERAMAAGEMAKEGGEHE